MLDSDVSNADNHLHVEFYTNEESGDYKGKPFVRIIVPGDKTNIIDQPVREDHKERFPRQWLYFQMKNTDTSVIGTPLQKWNTEFPDDFTRHQMEEMQILKFQTVEQIAEHFGKTGRGVKTVLTRRGLSCADYTPKTVED